VRGCGIEETSRGAGRKETRREKGGLKSDEEHQEGKKRTGNLDFEEQVDKTGWLGEENCKRLGLD